MTPAAETRNKPAAPGIFAFLRLYIDWLSPVNNAHLMPDLDMSPKEAHDMVMAYLYCLSVFILHCLILALDLLFPRGVSPLPALLSLPLLCLCCRLITCGRRIGLPLLLVSACLLAVYAIHFIGGTDDLVIFYCFWAPPLLVSCLSVRLSLAVFCCFIGFLSVFFLPQARAELAWFCDPLLLLRVILCLIGIYALSAITDLVIRRFFASILTMSKQLENYSLTDPLTGLGNRRQCMDHISRLHALYLRSGEPFSIIITDLDHFKRVNDTHGHPTGDAVLRFSADTLGATLRNHDKLYRWGGEEFIALLSDTGQEHAVIAAERMRQALEHSQFAQGSLRIRLTASLGAHTVKCPMDIQEHLKMADQLLYRAKAEGRNRVVSSEPCNNSRA